MVAGTTLIIVLTKDGLIIAVDGRGHSKDACGESTVDERTFKKLFVLDDGILIASHGLIECPRIEYKIENWVAEFIETHYRSLPSHDPSYVASAIDHKMRQTFNRMEAFPDDEIWKLNPTRGNHLVSYLVGGCCKADKSLKVFEMTANFNFNKKGVEYVPLFECRQNPLFLGSYKYATLARHPGRPEYQLWLRLRSDALATVSATPIPNCFHGDVAAAIAYIRVEAHFNPKHVGMSGTFAVVEPASLKPFSGAF